jgi:protein-tyrosine phosphatase
LYDIHNHILFGVDDGIETLEESVEVLKEYKSQGVELVVFTPHINHPNVKTDLFRIKEHYEILKSGCERIGIRCELGSELYLKPKFPEFFPILNRFVLIELDTMIYPLYLFDQIFELQLSGYDVILAHVERYQWLSENTYVIDKLKDMNVYFQMNINTLDSKNYYIKNGYIDFIATDYHGKKRSEIDWEKWKKFDEITKNGMKILKI